MPPTIVYEGDLSWDERQRLFSGNCRPAKKNTNKAVPADWVDAYWNNSGPVPEDLEKIVGPHINHHINGCVYPDFEAAARARWERWWEEAKNNAQELWDHGITKDGLAGENG